MHVMHTRRHRTAAPGPARQRGLTLVELMVGIAVGLFIVAAAAMLVVTQLNDNRRLLLETQLQQDLRAAAEIITRELRRAGHWTLSERLVWTAAGPNENNPFAAVTPDEEAATEAQFRYMRRPGEEGPFGFRLATVGSGSAARGVVQTLLAGGGWQDLTDSLVLDVTTFSVTPRHGAALPIACARLCADGSTDCWPTLTVREFVVDIVARSVRDPLVERRLTTVVRPRNDLVEFRTGVANQACPG
ncbi:prepilin-type N-terminal cleavage/methylation domain-containing protein [Calidifontimicrobium sp. SYSU G02091]|uniref:PilW family protein n=1 Tax=Calidifontimicrobium sp. SYSU G02091 TaxID=2926421 RepID=UPI001F52D5D4|nr:prepilin-type N-terminal cleavage/methylation domain-containing protein [Calidifontimicrobium sp. SYSU G02091]MCI1191786.1 prepilin-type N-terminal cleavage/methylation domain-containing protein [Calidifontimicrobium sp. SYSU G02091]